MQVVNAEITKPTPPSPELWQNRRYFSIGAQYKARFGTRMQKIALSVSQSCPNRLSDIGACLFCDEWGSAGVHVRPDLELMNQVQQYKKGMQARYNATQYLAYFQPYTTTFSRTQQLEAQIRLVLKDPDIKGIILGTRPDCLNASLLKLLHQLSQETYVAVELGIQSFDDSGLIFLNRGHDAQCAIEGVHKLKELKQVDTGVHLIFGLPGETDEDTYFAVEKINQLQVDNVKLHNLHVLNNTPLADLYRSGSFRPWDLQRYIQAVVLFLEHCSPQVAFSRLAAKATRFEELIAPAWTAEKMRPINEIEKRLLETQSWQGKQYTGPWI